MKSFQMPMLSTRGVAMSLLGLCLLSGLDTTVARADFVFGERTNLGPLFNTSAHEYAPCLSPNGLELYFSRGDEDLWVARRATLDSEWGPPTNLGPVVNIPGIDDGRTSLSADGLSLYFDSARPGGYGAHDLYVTTRPTLNDNWGPPLNLGATVNTAVDEVLPSITADGLELYFSSIRSDGFGDRDLWVTKRATVNDNWGPPVNLGATINTPYFDGWPCISADHLLLFLVSDRPGGYGWMDLYVARRATKNDAWAPPVNLGPKVNSTTLEHGGMISADGSTLYFDSLRSGGFGGVDLWQAPIIRFVDFNGDGQVDGKDVLCMVSRWGTDDPLCDIGPFAWGDGTVGLEDLTVLAGYLGKEVTDPTLIAHWALDETEGNAAHENVSGSGDIVLGGLWQPTGGQVNGALQLDGADDCLIAATALNPAKGPFSVLAWVKGGAPSQVVISEPTVANWLIADAEGKLITDLKSSGRDAAALLSQAVITDGQWHRIGLVWDGSRRMLYVDGVVVAEDTQSALPSSGNGLYIGTGKAMEPGTFWSGLIDDVRIYSRAVKP